LHAKLGVFGAVPILILQDKRVTPNALKVYIALRSIEGTSDACDPKQEAIAARAGIPVPGVGDAAQLLVATGWLVVTRRGLGKSNLYETCAYFEPAESFAKTDGRLTNFDRAANLILIRENFPNQEDRETFPTPDPGNVPDSDMGKLPDAPKDLRIKTLRKDSRVPPQKTSAREEKYPAAFEQWWKSYPRKKEKRAAFIKWKASLKKGATEEELQEAADGYAEECEKRGTAEVYTKHPATFLGPSEAWRDYLGTNGKPQTLAEVAVEMFGRR